MPVTKSDLDSLFARTEDGLTDAELRRVADFVRESSDASLQRRGLHILCWAHAREYAPLIASFLDRTDDLTLPAMALRALVVWFRDAGPHTDALKRFLHGIPEDEGGDLQLAALQTAGDAYRQTLNLDILRLVVEFASGGNDILREVAQNALVAGLTANWDQLTPRQRYDLRRSFATARYLEQARERLSLTVEGK